MCACRCGIRALADLMPYGEDLVGTFLNRVLTCPTNARLFGDAHDPESEVSKAITERDGYALMPEWGTRPANHYLPRKCAPPSPSSS